MDLRKLWKCLVVTLHLSAVMLSSAEAVRWLALVASLGTVPQKDGCEDLELSKPQRNMCGTEVMNSITRGSAMAIKECQNQFKFRRWNCSIQHFPQAMLAAQSFIRGHAGHSGSPHRHRGNNTTTRNKRKRNRKIRKRDTMTPLEGTREAAFVHAIASAGVTFAVTRECSGGKLFDCGCDRSVSGGKAYQWAGCSDNIHYGRLVAQKFVDSKRRKIDAQHMMDMHNNEAGRRVIEENMSTICKCHGVSGSCQIKTCWKTMPDFTKIGALLKDKFDGATEVRKAISNSRIKLTPVEAQYKPHTAVDLVYLELSPNYCDYDINTGSLGTHGRPCNRSSQATDGCNLLCCGRGHRTRRKVVQKRCHCKFVFCCEVKCDVCEEEVEESFCN